MQGPSLKRPVSTPSLLKIGEAAKVLGVSIDTLRRWEKAGKITTVRTPGGTRLYPLESLRKINPTLVEHYKQSFPFSDEKRQTSSISTEELLRRTESRTIDDGKWKIGVEDRSWNQDTTFNTPSLIKRSIFTKFYIASATFLVITLVITFWLTASYLTSPRETQQFIKNNIASGLLSPFHFLAESAVVIIDPTKARQLGFLPPQKPPPMPSGLSLGPSANVLAVTASPRFLEVNSDTQINGSLFVRDSINGLSLEATPSAGTIALNAGTTTLDITNSATIDQDISTTSSPTFDAPTFNTLNLANTNNQLIFQSGGPTGTLTWTPTAARVITLPDATTTLTGTNTTQTLTNKTMSGSSNTFSSIPNSALSNSSLTVSAGTNMTGGGSVSLGGSITLSLTGSPAVTSLTATTSIGVGTTSVDSTSILDLTSTTKGMLAPRMTTAQRDAISSPATGLFVYNTTTNAFNVYSGSSWGAIGGGGEFTLAGDSGTSQTISSSDTMTISGGTNGIDTVAGSTDTLTINFDATEVGTVTWGSGSSLVWTFDAGSADPTIDFNSGSLVFNEGGADVDFRVEGDNNANLLTIDAGQFSGVGQISAGSAAQSTATAFVVIDNPAITATSTQNFYKVFIDNNAAATVNTSASLFASMAIDEPNISGAPTNATTLYLSDAPTEGSSGNFALWVDNGESRFENLPVSGSTTAYALTVVPSYLVELADLTLSGVRIALDTNSNTDSGDVAYGLNIDDITTAAGPTEYAMRVGSGYDYQFYFELGTRDLRISATAPSGGTSPLTATIPALGADDTFCLATLANCFGGGGGSGVTYTSQTTNAITKFTDTAGQITSSSLTDDGTTLTLAANVSFTMTAGTGSTTQNFSPAGTTSTARALTLTPKFGLDVTNQTLAGLYINPNTNTNTDTGDILSGVHIDNITASDALESAIKLGTGWDNQVYFTDTTTIVKIANGGSILFEDDANGEGGDGNDICTMSDGGDLTCTGSITGGTSGTQGYWSRTSTTLSPATANDVVSVSSNDTTNAVLAVTSSGASPNALTLTADSVTTGKGMDISVDGLTTGTGVNITSTSTAGGGSGNSYMLNLARSGTNANATHVAYSLYSAVTNTGTTSTNVAGYFSASGATNNYGVVVDSGNVGIGDTTPTEGKLTVLDTSNTTSTASITNNTATTLGAASATGVVEINSSSLTTGSLLHLELNETNLDGGYYMRASDGTNTVFSVGEDGNTTIAGVEGSTVFTLTAGDAAISDGSLSITDDDDAASFSVTNNTATTIGAGINTAGVVDISSTTLTTGNLLNLETTTAFTSGRVLNVSSTTTSSSFSGNLGRFSWEPGSATTATADLFLISISSNGTTTGDLFDIQDNGSSVFQVSETAITNSLPASFTAPGDVSIAYDINFTNPTASYIKSAAPLNIEAGEVFNSSDLTLKTYNQGSIILTQDNTVASGATSYGVQVLSNLIDNAVNPTTHYSLYNVPTANITGDTLTTLYSDYIGFTNNAGTTSTWYGLYIANPTGSGTTGTKYAFVTEASSGNVGIGDTTPDALLDIDSSSTNGGNFLITNTGAGTSGSIAKITANSVTTGDILTLSATALTSGSSLVITGPSAGTAGVTDAAIKLTSDVGNIGTSNGLISSTATFDGSTATGINLYLSSSDAIVSGNTDYGIYNTVSNTGAITTQTKNVYGSYTAATGTGGTTTTPTTNVYGSYITTTASHATDVGTVNQYGLYIADGTSSTNGTATKSLLYVEAPTGADANYAGIFAGGNVGIGDTTPGYRLEVNTDISTSYVAQFFNDGNNADRYGIQIQAGADDATGTTYYLNALDGDGGQVGYIANTAGTFALTDPSDIRLKTNIGDTALDGLDIINNLRVVDFNRLTSPDGPKITGFIAQEAQEIFPQMVSVGPDGMLGISKELLIPVLVKAVQEQQTAIDSLSAVFSDLSIDSNGTLNIPSLKTDHLLLSQDVNGYVDLSRTIASLEDRIKSLESRIKSQDNVILASPEGTRPESDSGVADAPQNDNVATSSAQIAGVQTSTPSASLAEATPSATPVILISSESTSSATSILNLTPPDILLATSSAQLVDLQVTSDATISGTLTAYNLNVQDGFKSLGTSILGNTTIAGDLTVDGTMNISGSSLSTLGNLSIQNNSLAGPVDFFNGLVTIDKEGTVTISKLTVSSTKDIITDNDPTIGSGILKAGQNTITITNNQITSSAKIFVTPRGKTGSQPLIVDFIKPYTSFTVSIEKPYTKDINFDWWIIETK